ncbi:MAG TPA: 4Fe-4S ferredoxin, partial [Elusimicrobia bacterium]|nr:4Fe-4S ferredoxin [Elusimicrobiota bacterium]
MAADPEPLDPDVLDALIDRLNMYPVGLPDAPEIREFLSIFLTPDEARLASLFPLSEATAGELARKAGWEEGRTRKTLEAMAQKGTVVDVALGGSRYWLLTPSVVGFVEFSLMKLHAGIPMRRLAELLEKYSEERLWKEVFGAGTAPMRALIGEGVPVSSRIATYAQVETVVRAFGQGAAQDCYCRRKEELLGHSCRLAAVEGTCFSLGLAADFMVRRGFARMLGADEILARIRDLGSRGLIHVTDNVRDQPSFVCNCCGCCCNVLDAVRRKGARSAV